MFKHFILFFAAILILSISDAKSLTSLNNLMKNRYEEADQAIDIVKDLLQDLNTEINTKKSRFLLFFK